MLSIGSFARHNDGKGNKNVAVAEIGEKRVLPRILRKPARLFNRLLAGNLVISSKEWTAIALAGAVIACMGVIANSRQEGYSVLAEAPEGMGFGINGISIVGVHEEPESLFQNSSMRGENGDFENKNAVYVPIHEYRKRINCHLQNDRGCFETGSEGDVMHRLEIGSASSLLSFNLKKARENLLSLDWVRDAAVKKVYPDQLVVRIEEYEPFAVWQNGNVLSLIERGGKRIGRFRKKFAGLPLLVGKGANIHGANAVSLVAGVPAFEKRVKAYVRVANQRWDIWLENGTIVRLPDENVNEAIKRLVWLDETYDLLSRDVEIVDLRLKNRLVVTSRQFAPGNRVRQSENPAPAGKGKKI